MSNRPIMRDVNTPSNLIQSNNLSPFLMEKKNIKETRNQKASKEEKFERKFLVTQLNHKRMNFIINFINN